MFRLFECCALSFFERFVLSFSLKIERFVSDSAEIWICGLYTHEKPEDGVLGELITSIPTIGGNYDDNGQSVGSNKFWLLTLDENYITIYHPGKYSGGVDWDDSGWYAYFKTEAGTDSE